MFSFLSLKIPSGFEPPKIECASAFGVEFRNKINDSAITSSTEYSESWGSAQARIRNKNGDGHSNCWLAKSNNEYQWIQVDLGDIVKITKLATQGREDASQWVKSYTLSYSLNCGIFEPYNNNEVHVIRIKSFNFSFKSTFFIRNGRPSNIPSTQCGG